VATNRPTIDNNGSPILYKELMIDYHSNLEYEVYRRSLEDELITSSSSRKIPRSGLRQLGADEEPGEVAGSCDVIGSVISECKHSADINPINRGIKSANHINYSTC
jgi:hypothetical protein